MNQQTTLLGQTLKLPLQSVDGALALASGEEAVFQALELIFTSDKGVYPLDPDFGFTLQAYDTQDAIDLALVRIGRAVEAREPRVERLKLSASRPADGVLTVSVECAFVGTATPALRTFPLRY
jgi:phage baseplate assembly protein W